VALNIDVDPMRVSLSDFGIANGRIVAGSGAPPENISSRAEIEPHGWLIIAPA
jgi:cyclomaltodextrinase